MADLPDRLKDYIPVAQRIEKFYAKFPDGSLQSEVVELSEDRVVMRAYAYRTPEDPRPGMGYSSMPLPAKNVMLRDSEIETCETSAWGRAIAALGFEVQKGIASRNEIEAKSGATEERTDNPDGSLIGVVSQGKPPVDYELRQEATKGAMAGFKLTQGRKGLQVLAYGPLASALQPFLAGLDGQRVSVWGTVVMVDWEREGKPMPPYRRLILSKIQTPDWILPGQNPRAVEGPPPDEEAESEPLGLIKDDDLSDLPPEWVA